jgi:hypothetical protein
MGLVAADGDNTCVAEKFVAFNLCMVPKYWELPELLDDYVRMWEKKA